MAKFICPHSAQQTLSIYRGIVLINHLGKKKCGPKTAKTSKCTKIMQIDHKVSFSDSPSNVKENVYHVILLFGRCYMGYLVFECSNMVCSTRVIEQTA